MKQIKIKKWLFSERVTGPVVEKEKQFLFWKWKKQYTPKFYKYKTKEELLEEVNKFIADNQIDNIIKFTNTAKIQKYVSGDFGCEGYEWEENEGFIEITYLQEINAI